jgi:mRNA deadenylase 3'-5' endonuclease subunit Ccr4
MRIGGFRVDVVTAGLLLPFLCQTVSSFQAIRSTQNTRQNPGLDSTTVPEPLTAQATEIILPHGSFRDTESGELSVTSLNILAPSYHWLGLGQEEKDSRIVDDRQKRVPQAIDMAKQTNADILCMQEVEGGPSNEAALEEFLLKPCGDLPGYDSHLWSALHPNRKGDVVGLCVAWRSKTHNVSSAKTRIVCYINFVTSRAYQSTNFFNS